MSNSSRIRPTPRRADPLPQYATRRRPERPTQGPAVAAIAELLGLTLHPWQRRFADVFLELVPDVETGDLVHAYTDGSLSVGRRAGKSLLLFLLGLRAMLAAPRVGVRFTAQDRASAVLQLREEWLPTIEHTALGPAIRSRLTNGSESIWTPHNNSFIRLFAPTPTALHGSESTLVMLDEGFAHSLERGTEISTAVKPTTYTVPGAQVLWTSAAGDLDSTWWARVLDVGRSAVIDDRGVGLCHFEWTVDGTELDPDDETTWALVHPGAIPLDVQRAAYHADRSQFVRTILNQTDRAGSTGSPVDATAWRRLGAQVLGDRESTMALGVDCSPDQATGAIVAAMEGATYVEVIDHRPGTDWIPGALARLVDRYDVAAVGYDPGGPAGALTAPCTALGLPLRGLPLRDVAGAAAAFASLVSTGGIRYRPDASLDAAVDGARRRAVGDGSWSVSRRNSPVDVSPLLAAILAVAVHPDAFEQLPPTVQ